MKEHSEFFNLNTFSHKSLWQKDQPVWAPLFLLKNYFEKYSQYSIDVDIPHGVFLENREQIAIGEGTIIEPGAFIKGPCIIGKNCRISHGAYIRESVILGDDCHIGHSSELKHSILLDSAAATHFVYVGDSILGNFVNLGAGVKCANLRLDRGSVTIDISGEKINTGLMKFGAIVGDLVQIGCNCVLNPGTLIGKESFSYPLMHLSGFIEPRHQVSAKGKEPIKQKILEKLLWQSKHIVSK
jgi:NDP-sugar pyrophosphorylase family protein